jgi:hypothetical protein
LQQVLREAGGPEMLILTAACFIGILVGLHCRVLALIPLELAGGLVWLTCVLFFGATVSAAIFNFVFATISLQGGYMIGVAGREFLSRIGLV